MADRGQTYTVSLFGTDRGPDGAEDDSPSRMQQALVDFVMDFTLDNIFIYRYGWYQPMLLYNAED